MEFLLRVMKNTWLLPPDLTDAKNTCLEAKKYLLDYFYYCKKKPVNCLGEQGKQELPHTLWSPLPKPPSLLLFSS